MKGKITLPSNKTITVLVPLLMPTRTSNQITHDSNKQKPFRIRKKNQSRTIAKPNNVALSLAIGIEIEMIKRRANHETVIARTRLRSQQRTHFGF